MVDQPKISLATRVQFIAGIGPDRAERLGRLGVNTAGDLLFFMPRDYERPAPPASIDQLREGQPASLVGTISDAELASRTPGKSVFAAILENDTGAVRLLFFNQPFRAEQITIGRHVQISGAPKMHGLRMEFTHPNLTLLDDEGAADEAAIARILPIYPLTEGLRQRDLRKSIALVVDALADSLVEVLPEALRQRAGERLGRLEEDLPQLNADMLPAIASTMRSVHQPESEAALHAARTRLIFQELLVMQLALAIRRRQLTTDLQAPALPPSTMIDARILNRFPFELTGDQQRAIAEIGRDMSRQFPMNRLLQGDVGSGKTVVALYAMMLAVAHRHQAVLMVPTEILARQHQRTFAAALAASRVRIGLLSGSLSAAERRHTLADVSTGKIDLLIGTQALVYGKLEFHRLGLCVIDEQHKFGVRQRVSLRSGGVDPHYLVMSATPIPRSIAMTVFGDVDLSTIREQPPGRASVNTYLAESGWETRWWKFVRARLDEGRQVYVVAPRISSAEKADGGGESESESAVDVSSVERLCAELRVGELAGYRVGLLHGGLPADEKQAVMQSFAQGRLQILVTTTVIEVGIDVPNASVMTITGANRFGLAQLHQLRGRVGRGTHAGHVAVFTDGAGSPQDVERLQIFAASRDGFELAEADFRLRGPGDLLGDRQSGLPPLRIADLLRDQSILTVAREVAQQIVDADPQLEAPELVDLRAQVLRRYEERLNLGDVA